MLNSRIVTVAAAAIAGAGLLTACSSNNADTTATVTSESTVATTVTDESTVTDTTAVDAKSTSVVSDVDNDSAYAAIEAALGHTAGTVVGIDRHDMTNIFDVDVATGDKVVELRVDGTTVTEQESDRDADDAAKATQATVTAEDAIKEALAQHDGILDSAELDENNGDLRWEIDINNADGTDLAELNIAAK